MIEYTLVIVIVIGALLAMQKYIVRGFAGQWKRAGDSFGYEKQYDPKLTTRCAWLDDKEYSKWYQVECFDDKIKTYFDPCLDMCLAGSGWGNCADPGMTCTGGIPYQCCTVACKKGCARTVSSQCPGSDVACAQ